MHKPFCAVIIIKKSVILKFTVDVVMVVTRSRKIGSDGDYQKNKKRRVLELKVLWKNENITLFN